MKTKTIKTTKTSKEVKRTRAAAVCKIELVPATSTKHGKVFTVWMEGRGLGNPGLFVHAPSAPAAREVLADYIFNELLAVEGNLLCHLDCEPED